MIPSRYEGFPLVMLEAMYFRLPVIASAVDGMADLLPPHWLFPSGDVSALAARVWRQVGGNPAFLLESLKLLLSLGSAALSAAVVPVKVTV